eukprot:jgi/Tetstr1/421429/TSEL_012378.t1
MFAQFCHSVVRRGQGVVEPGTEWRRVEGYAIHVNGQKASWDELAKRVNRCFKPGEIKSCAITADYEYVSANVEGYDNRHAHEWSWFTENGSSVRVMADVDGPVNPCLSRNTPPVYHSAPSAAATRMFG